MFKVTFVNNEYVLVNKESAEKLAKSTTTRPYIFIEADHHLGKKRFFINPSCITYISSNYYVEKGKDCFN